MFLESHYDYWLFVLLRNYNCFLKHFFLDSALLYILDYNSCNKIFLINADYYIERSLLIFYHRKY